jgi:hypothetical protein
MNRQPVERYRALLTQLLVEREAAGGELSEEAESRLVPLLDEVWWQLSSSEQDQLERELKQVTVHVREASELVDPEPDAGGNPGDERSGRGN